MAAHDHNHNHQALVDIALAYAQQGWHVAPLHTRTTLPAGEWDDTDRHVCSCRRDDCSSPAKHPRTKNGLKDATTNPDTIRAWWAQWPDANIGIRTGNISGIVVVDVDSYKDTGVDGVELLEQEHGPLPPTLTADTGGGGRHLIYRHPGGDRIIRNRAGLAPGVDLRGDGGYIVAPPSLHMSGNRYLWRRPLAEIGDSPEHLYAETPQAERAAIGPIRRVENPSEHPWIRAAFDGELDDLRRAQQGTRNHQLNAAAFNLGQLVPHALTEHEVTNALHATALAIGLGEHEAATTIRSGLDAGMARPRPVPEPPTPRPRPDSGLHGAQKAEPAQPPTLTLRWLTEVWDNPPAQPEPLVDGLLSRGEMCVIGAPRAIGKSFLAMNLATLLGRGEGQLAGHLNIARRSRVLYAQGELSEGEAFARWYRMTGTPGPPEGVAETYDRWRLRTVTRRSATSGRDDGGGWSESDEYIEAVLDARLEQTIVTNKIDVLIIDPWAVYYAGAENSNDEVEAALDKLRDLSLRHGLAVVVFHHIGKSRDAAEPEDLWRGASRLADWASTRVTILPHFSDRERVERQMTRQDARRYCDVFILRRGAPTPDFSMTIDHKAGWWRDWTPPGRPVTVTHSTVDVALACRQAGGWTSVVQAAAALETNRNKAADLLAAAVVAGHLDEVTGPRNSKAYVPSQAFLDTHPEAV